MGKYLFRQEISGRESWADVFRKADSFVLLAGNILNTHGFSAPELQSLTPGTNAVFRAGEQVIKLYAPLESGIWSANALRRELCALRFASGAGVRVPTVLGYGKIRDKYCFSYLITEFLQGEEAGAVLPCFSAKQKTVFADKMRSVVEKLHQPVEDMPEAISKGGRASWQCFPQSLQEEMEGIAASVPPREKVFVHGDLTGENVLLLPDGEIALLDFGDARLAPVCYELPALVFELFRGDKAMVARYFTGENRGIILEELLSGLSLHEFAGYIVRDLFAHRGISPGCMQNVAELLSFFKDILFDI